MILHGDNVLLFNGCDNWLDQCLFDSTYFVENSEILVVHDFKFVQGDTCCVVGYLQNTRVHRTYIRNRWQCGVLHIGYQKSKMSVSATSQVGVDIKSVAFQLKLHSVQGIVGVNSKDSGKVWFRGSLPWRCSCWSRGIILSYIYKQEKKDDKSHLRNK